jgi:voltage-gated potassium channel
MFALVAILAIGSGGYMLIEGWGLLDALYMTVITITTVGYLEVHALSETGRIFTIFLLFGGVGGALYALTAIVQFVMEAIWAAPWGATDEKSYLGLERPFYTVRLRAGGHEIARVLAEEGVPFVVVDKDKEAIAHAEMDGRLYLLADAAMKPCSRRQALSGARPDCSPGQ